MSFGYNVPVHEERAALVATYWRYVARSDSANREDRLAAAQDLWSIDQVAQIVESGGAQAVQLVVDLALAAPDDVALSRLGAGPFEVLIDWHGPDLLDELEEAARRMPVVRTALASVWCFAATPEVVQRLSKFGLPDLRP